MNKGDVKDSEMSEIINTITDGLFSVFSTIGCIPIIRCPRGNAAEVIAEVIQIFCNVRAMHDSSAIVKKNLFIYYSIEYSFLIRNKKKNFFKVTQVVFFGIKVKKKIIFLPNL